MKFANIILKFVVPFLMIWVLLRTDIILGIGGVIIYLAYLAWSGQTAVYAYLGNINYQQGKQAEAFRWFEKAVAPKNTRPNYLIGYGFLQLKHGDTAKAEQLLKRASTMTLTRDERMSLDSNMALLLWKQGNLQEATERMEALYADFKNTYVYGSLGYFYILSGDLDKALAFNKEAYEFNDSGAVIMDNLGQTYLLRGEYEEALALYKKLEEQKPTFPEAYYNHGLVLEALGQREEALTQLKKALDYPVSLLSTVSREEIEAKIKELESGSDSNIQ